MTAQASLDQLVTLAQLDIDAAQAYEQAIDGIDIPEIRDRLDDFREDHERHVDELSAAITRLGGEPPRREADFKGYVIEGYTAVRSAMGIAGALRAMKNNEILANTIYEQALSLDLPDDVKAIIERNREDERRHLAYIEAVLEDRVWELDPATGKFAHLTSDLGQLLPIALGGALVANALLRPSKAGTVGGVLGAALVFAAMQSGLNPGRLIPARSLAGGNAQPDQQDRRRVHEPGRASVH
jgi:rubrerythrin